MVEGSLMHCGRDSLKRIWVKYKMVLINIRMTVAQGVWMRAFNSLARSGKHSSEDSKCFSGVVWTTLTLTCAPLPP